MLNRKNILLIFSSLIIFFLVIAGLFFVFAKYEHNSAVEGRVSSVNSNLDIVAPEPLAEASISEPKSISITIAGDTMFDRAVDFYNRGEKIFDVVSNIKDVFGKTDVSFLNLEGPISATEIPADGTRDSMNFNMPPLVTEVLLGMKIDGVSLANNHTNNQGKAGLANTKQVLNENNILTVGEESTFGDYSIGRFIHNDAKLSIITINCLEVTKDLTEEITLEKATGAKVLVYPHWGEEYNPIHNFTQEKLAHSWIDAGADLIIGSHPHVVQDAEEYLGKPIFYSLGNFVFDQTWSQPTQQGLIIKAIFVDNNLEIELLPIVINRYKPELKTGEAKDEVVNKFFENFGQDKSGGNLKFKI